jgi:hypothetical protein
MCQKAKTGCESTMQRLVGFNWPEYIDCWRFPSYHSDVACVTDHTYTHKAEQSLGNYAAMQPFGNEAAQFMSTLNKQQHDMFLKTLENVANPTSPLQSQRYIIAPEKQLYYYYFCFKNHNYYYYYLNLRVS